MAFTTRRDVYLDAVAKLKPYLNSTSKEDFVAAILTGQDLIAANTSTDIEYNQRTEFLQRLLGPIVDVINGGYYTTEILERLEEALKGTADGGKNQSAQRIAEFIRFTLSTNVNSLYSSSAEGTVALGAQRFPECFKAKIINSAGDLALAPEIVLESIATPQAGFWVPIGNPSPSKTSTHVSVIEVLNSNLGTSVRDTTGLSIFASLIPTHVISRAVPYVSLRIHGAPTTAQGEDGRISAKSMNLLRYLKGEVPWNSSNPSDGILGFEGETVADETGIYPTPGGMELFTAPQTMVSDELWTAGFSKSKPIDRFRPLMTLTSLSIDVASAAAGFMSFKTAKAEIVLHDRGRLAEVAPFVKAGLYGSTEIEIEYGWSIDASAGRKASPADATAAAVRGEEMSVGDAIYGARLKDDTLAQFVDSLRVTEKYIVVNSTFNFDDTGQVNISLDLSMKGAADARSLDITASTPSTAKERLRAIIEDLNSTLTGTSEQLKSVIPENLLGAVASEDAVYALDEKQLKEVAADVKKFQKSRSSEASLSSIAAKMNAALAANEEAKTAAVRAVDQMFSNMVVGASATFPSCEEELARNFGGGTGAGGVVLNDAGNLWHYKTAKGALEYSGLKPLSSDAYEGGAVSLGAALVTLAGNPLQASGKFDEIQFIFNKFNDRAGFMRSLSTAAFPLDYNKLKDSVTKLYKENVRVSISQLISVIADQHVGDIAHPAYGFSTAYDKDGKLIEQKQGEPSIIDQALKNAGILDSQFQKPQLSVQFECVPHWQRKEETILRVYVRDESCSAYQEYAEAITAGRSDVTRFVDMGSISPKHPLFTRGFVTNDLSSAVILKTRTDVFTKMQSEGVLTAVATTSAAPDTSEWKIDLNALFRAGDPRKLKSFMQRGLPVIRYGSSAGLVTNISVSSISDPRMNTVSMLRNNETSGQAESSARERGLPLLVNGTEVNVDMVGCPILNFGQSFYIDFGTNTSIDNIYVCTGLSHKITPGEFTTTGKFTLNVGAFGIYSSAAREFKVAASLAQLLGRGPAPVSGSATSSTATTPKPTPIESLMGTVSLDDLYTQIEVVKTINRAISGLRFWMSTDGQPASSLSKYFKLNLVGDSHIEVVTPVSTSPQGLASLTPEQEKYRCYEIAIPTTKSVNIQQKGYLYDFSPRGAPPIKRNVLYVNMDGFDAVISGKKEEVASMKRERKSQ